MDEKLQSIQQKIRKVKSDLENARARVPKHDIPGALMAEIDELEEKLAELQGQLNTPESLSVEIKRVEAQLANARSRMPKHDIPPALMQEIDELEEELERLKAQRAAKS